MPEYVNLLDKITKDRELPEGYDDWAIRTVGLDFRSSRGFRYPFPGSVAEAPGPINVDHAGEYPSGRGDGICAALDWQGMASGGMSARMLLLVAYRKADVLGRSASKLRLSRLFVVDVLSGEDVVRTARSANLYSANLYGADLRSANLYSANLRSANLRSANLRSADLRSANLYGANLRSAIGLTQPQIATARRDNWTRLPDGLVIPV